METLFFKKTWSSFEGKKKEESRCQSECKSEPHPPFCLTASTDNLFSQPQPQNPELQGIENIPQHMSESIFKEIEIPRFAF